MEDKQYIVLFELSNGKKYLVCHGYVFIQLHKPMTLNGLQAIARFYTLKGAKCISSRLWKEFSWEHEKKNGGKIVKSQYISLKYIKDRLQYFVNGKYIINL